MQSPDGKKKKIGYSFHLGLLPTLYLLLLKGAEQYYHHGVFCSRSCLMDYNTGLTEKPLRDHVPEELTLPLPRVPNLGDLHPEIDQHTYLTAARFQSQSHLDLLHFIDT